MASLTEETTHSRDSLLAANAQVATLKAQLDKAVDEKVNKKLASRLKVSLVVVVSLGGADRFAVLLSRPTED